MIQPYVSKALLGTISIWHGFEAEDVEDRKETMTTDNGIGTMLFHMVRHDAKREDITTLTEEKRE